MVFPRQSQHFPSRGENTRTPAAPSTEPSTKCGAPLSLADVARGAPRWRGRRGSHRGRRSPGAAGGAAKRVQKRKTAA
eukprot:gene23568-biopygen13378